MNNEELARILAVGRPWGADAIIDDRFWMVLELEDGTLSLQDLPTSPRWTTGKPGYTKEDIIGYPCWVERRGEYVEFKRMWGMPGEN